MPADDFPKRTAPGRVKGFKITGELIEVDAKNGLALYHFPNDAVLSDAWEAWLTAPDARSSREVAALARDNYRAFREP